MKFLLLVIISMAKSAQAYDVDFNLNNLEIEIAKAYNVSRIYVDDLTPYRLDNLINRLPMRGLHQGNTHYEFKYHLEKLGHTITVTCDILHNKKSRDLFLMPCNHQIPAAIRHRPELRRAIPRGFWYDYDMLGM